MIETLASDDGTRAGGGKATGPAGAALELLTDLEGRLLASVTPGPPGFGTHWQYGVAALAASKDVHPGAAAILQGVSGYVAAGGAGTFYVQAYDLAAGPPGVGNTPVNVIPIVAPAAGRINWSWAPIGGWAFADGIVFAISTTEFTYTSAGDLLYVNATGLEAP